MEQNTLLEESRRTNALLQKQLFWSRCIAALLAGMLLVVTVCFGSIAGSINRTANLIEALDLTSLSDQLSQLDLTAMADQIAQIDFSEVSTQLSELDMDAVNGLISALEQQLNEIDTQAFNDAVAKLNSAVDTLQSASDAVKRWGDGFSGLFGQP